MLSLSGCPVTDDYFLLPDALPGQGGDTSQAGAAAGGSTKAGSSAAGSTEQGGSTAQAGSITGGTAGTGTSGESGAAMGGMPDAGGGPPLGEAGMPGNEAGAAGGPAECVPTTERCNGHDDDCDDSIDEFVCQSNCYGFVLASDPAHGYMFCNGARKATWDNAKDACEDQDMRLAWLTTAVENTAVAQRLDSLGTDVEVLFGATDQGNEGDWLWAAGPQFWKGYGNGYPVGGHYTDWSVGQPNNMNNEDCALVNVMTGAWGDRTCNATYPYVCEQPD
jgi:hypothetical protein